MVFAYRVSLAIVMAAGLVTPAFAGSPAPAQPPAGATAPDPNEVICQKQEETGSRLSRKRVCMTRAQWADRQLQDRQELERVQIQRGAKSE